MRNWRMGACYVILAVLAIASVYGWLAHWNAYVNLTLTLGFLVNCRVFYIATRSLSAAVPESSDDGASDFC